MSGTFCSLLSPLLSPLLSLFFSHVQILICILSICYIISGSIILWNALNGYKLAVIDLSCAWVMSCAMSDSGRLTASGGLDNLVTIYKLPDYSSDDVKTDKLKHHKQLADHEGYISAAVFLDDQRVVSSSGDNKCIVWDVETGKALNVFSEHIADVQDVDKIPNTDLIVSGSIDKKCRVWDIRQDSKTKALAFAGHEGDVNAVSALHNGNSFVSGSDDASCMLFDIRSYGPLQAYGQRNIVSTISSVGVSSSGRYIFAGYDDYNCRVWDTLRGTMAISENVNNLKLHTNRVSCLGVNSAGTALCTGSWDLTLRVFA